MKNTRKMFKGFSKLFGIIAVTSIIVLALAGCVSYSVQSVAISATNNATQIKAGETLQFSFNVEASGKDTSKAQTVKWNVSSTADGKGPVISGTSINSSGLLTVSANEIYPVIYVTASHAVFSSNKDQRQLTVSGPKVGSVVFSTAASSVVVGKTVKLSAFVAGQAPNQNLTYSVGSKNDGTGAVTPGTSIAADGTLTVAAGEKNPSVFVRAVSNADRTKFDVKEIKVVSVTAVTVTADGGNARVLRGAKLKFTAAVTGVNNPGTGVTWKVATKNDGTGDVTSGTTIAADGTLTVAATEAAATLYVIATSSVDTTKLGSIAVVIPTVTSVTVTPANPQVKRGDGATFKARVAGTGDPSQDVTWKLDGVGGTTTATTITNNGTIIVSTAETLSQLLVTATSVDDTTKSGSTIITIPAVPAAIVPAEPAAQATAPAASAATSTASNATAEADFDTKTVSNTIEITKYKGSVAAVIIPATIKNLPVTSIGQEAFKNSATLTSVTIPNSVTKIGSSAFYSCTKLTSVNMGSGVTEIALGAFMGCTALKSITIPNSVTKIGMNAFTNCTGLTSLTIPSSVIDISMSAFHSCSGLTAINVDTANTKYSSDNGVLYNKNKTVLHTYPAGKTGAFTIPDSVTGIETSAFYDCNGLTGVTIPNSVKTIGQAAFRSCKGLTSVTIPNSITTIENYTFTSCTNLTSVNIPDSVTKVGGDAFYDTAWFNSVKAGVFYVGKIAQTYKGTMPANTSVTIADGTKIIAENAFKNYYGNTVGLISVTIPNSVTTIEEGAFSNCTNLNNVTIPSSVTKIGMYAFGTCTSLTSITFAGSIPSSGLVDSAFFDQGDLRAKYLAGGPGTYTTTAPVSKNSVWMKK